MTWDEILKEESKKAYFQKLQAFVETEYQTKNIFPKKENIYHALEATPIDKVKVVILGQDPYATPGFAMGLAFSVNEGIQIPKSLVNIYKEISSELDLPIPTTGNLSSWSKKGILLLNRILTVEEGKPLSHKNKGWEIFTLRLIEELNKQDQKMVFLLLGNEARSLSPMLNNPNHLVLETSHPSPLGAYHGFIGSGIFKKTCDYLGESKELWRIEE